MIFRREVIIWLNCFSLLILPFLSKAGETDSLPAKEKLRPMSLLVPGLLVGSGIVLVSKAGENVRSEVMSFRNRNYPGFNHSADDYLWGVPLVATYGLAIGGVKGKDDYLNMTLKLIKAEAIVFAIVYPTKNLTRIYRPDSTERKSFPSGHTAHAFVAAAFLDDQFREVSPWISVAGYTVATSVGVMRVLNNRHWISDVLAGAGIGMASMKISAATHRYRWGSKGPQLSVVPWMNESRQLGFVSLIRF